MPPMNTRTSNSPRRERVKELRAQGLKVSEIARILGITTQAVYKHLRKMRDGDGETTA